MHPHSNGLTLGRMLQMLSAADEALDRSAPHNVVPNQEPNVGAGGEGGSMPLVSEGSDSDVKDAPAAKAEDSVDSIELEGTKKRGGIWGLLGY